MSRPLIRVFTKQPLHASSSVALPREPSHYITTVMRQAVGSQIELFNGTDGAWVAEIIDANRKQCVVQLLRQAIAQEIPPDLWLCMAPLKKGRIDWAVEKACELGVAKVLTVITARTVVDRLNIERLTAHMIEAAEQCGRTHVPDIVEPVALTKLLQMWPTDRGLLFCDESATTTNSPQAWREAQARHKALYHKHGILIGPEGGFTDSERLLINALPQTACLPLGPRILRADTAAVAAITLFQSTIGDW